MSGELIADLYGNTLFQTSESLEDQGRIVEPVSFVVTNDMIGNGSVKIYFELVPNNEIEEIDENNNLGWTNLGYVCNSPGGALSVGNFAIEDKKFEFRLFPNPSADAVNIDFQGVLNYINDNVVLSIYNLSGQLQEQLNIGNQVKSSFSFDISHLTHGAYIIQVHTPTEVIFNSKLVVIN